MNKNRMYDTTGTSHSNSNHFDFHEMIAELSADSPNPIAFSKTLPFHQPKYGLFAEVRANKLIGDFVYYSICKAIKPGRYDHTNPIYETSSFEDIADEWIIFGNG